MPKTRAKEVELDEEEGIVPPVEKADDAADPLEEGAAAEESSTDEAGFADEELDPFQDKWEQ